VIYDDVNKIHSEDSKYGFTFDTTIFSENDGLQKLISFVFLVSFFNGRNEIGARFNFFAYINKYELEKRNYFNARLTFALC